MVLLAVFAISDISITELASGDMARLLGVDRLAATARSRLDEEIAHARLHMAAQDRKT